MCTNTIRTLPIPTSLLCRREVLVWGTLKFKPHFHHSKTHLRGKDKSQSRALVYPYGFLSGVWTWNLFSNWNIFVYACMCLSVCLCVPGVCLCMCLSVCNASVSICGVSVCRSEVHLCWCSLGAIHLGFWGRVSLEPRAVQLGWAVLRHLLFSTPSALGL